VLAKDDPVFWLFWIGLILIAVVLFAPGGLLGLIERIASLWRPTSKMVDVRRPAKIEYKKAGQ